MAHQVRISGIVRLAHRVRQELAGGAPPARLEYLRQAVRQALDVTDRALKDAGAGPDALPVPTRMAYRFLATVDLGGSAAAPLAPTHEDAPGNAPTQGLPPGSMHFPGLRTWLDHILTLLSQTQDDGERQRIGAAIRTLHANLEQGLREEDLQAAHLKAGARALFGWLAYFAREENFVAYLRALARAKAAFDEAQPRQIRFPPPVAIHFRPMKGVYRVRGLADGTLVHLPTAMISFDEELFRALAAMAFLRQGDKRPVLEAMAGPAYQAILGEVEPHDGGGQAAGLHHSLEEAFARVNAAYFGGTMQRPALQWSRRFTVRKFGHYDSLRDAVMISASLDRADVAAHVVDFVMYHELLHRKRGTQWNGDRKAVHTPEFLAQERRFARYAEAKAFLDRLARTCGG